MLPFVPVAFDLYRPLRPHLRWTLQCLVSFANRAGKCWPSVRKLAEQAGISKSAAARHLAELSRIGIVSRVRRPGRVYLYQIDRQFLPRAPVSHQREAAVPTQPRQETEPRKQTGSLARFAKSERTGGELPDDAAKWEARLRSWHRSRFWLPFWGPKPNEAGCFVPPALVQAMQ